MSDGLRLVALVVDDSAVMRSTVCAALREMGIDSREAGDGAEAWRLMLEARFDLVVTDVHMPHVDGIKLVGMIRSTERHRETRIVVMSAEGTDADLRRAIDLGADAVLRKQAQRNDLAEAVRRALALRA